MLAPAAIDDVCDALLARMPTHRSDLERLVRIPSVSADGFDPRRVRDSAEAVRDLLAERGLEHVRLLEVDGAHPAVYGDWLHAGDGAPSVLLYAHHDVQPPGDPTDWTSPPFEPTERGERLFGRGAADDKAGILVHVAAIDAWLRARGRLPVNVKVLVEGEEETGSEHLGDFLQAYVDLLRADVIVVTDSANWRVGVPSITYLLRGLVDCVVEVRGLDHALHSGMYGGPVPDPLTGLVKLLAAMTDARGSVAIPGFCDDVRAPTEVERDRLAALDFDLGRFRTDAGLLEGVELGGQPDLHPLERLWMRPNATIIGIDAPSVAESSNTIVPSARARVSVRLAPGQDPRRARDLLCGWLSANVPWGLHVRVTPGAAVGAFVADPFQGPARPAFEAAARALEAAYGHPVAHVGVGGTIPLIEPLSQAFGDAPALLTGVEDPDTRAHGVDESLHLADWVHACLAEAYLFAELQAVPRAAPQEPPAGREPGVRAAPQEPPAGGERV
ncbi:MAG: M20/M25/M40 family metallo-hydrolase [Actinomycetota bacterium]|nr:M20/M25/M40 family metallo-hydrolase [Actinomycetota bacterium]